MRPQLATADPKHYIVRNPDELKAKRLDNGEADRAMPTIFLATRLGYILARWGSEVSKPTYGA